METLTVPASVRRKLGDEASEGLVEMFGLYHQLASERFERLLTEETSGLRLEMHQEMSGVRLEMHQGFAALRQEMQQGNAALRQEIATSHVMWLRWSFLFWIGQVAAIAGLLAYMLPAAGR